MRRALLVGPGDHRLQRQVARLDQVAGGLRRLRDDRAAGTEHGDDQRVPAGPEPAVEGRDVQQHPVADAGAGHQVGVDQRPHLAPVSSRRAVSSTAPRQPPVSAATVPDAHTITPEP